MSFIDIEESMVLPSAADEVAVAHEEVREAADVGISAAEGSMGSVQGRSGREIPVLAQEISGVVMVTRRAMDCRRVRVRSQCSLSQAADG
jgi:predicted RNA-binding protein YlqC (UPF0109 family)